MGYASREIQFLDMTKGERLRRYIEAKNLDASNALIIGDTVEEIEIARELGMGCIAITGGVNSESRLREKSPDHIIHSLQELKPILQERGFMS
jgi:phosphoglycolate phosphatase